MWYRVEFNKDGSIRECVQVSGAADGTQTIVYVYANSKPHAIRDATFWRTRFMAAIKAERASRKKARGRNARVYVNAVVTLLLEVRTAFQQKPDSFDNWLGKRIEEAKNSGV